MALIERTALPEPPLPKRTVQVDALGGEVIVRSLRLADRLALSVGDEAVGPAFLARLLAATVVLQDGEPLWGVAQWEDFGGAHLPETLRVAEVALELNGFKAESAEKN